MKIYPMITSPIFKQYIWGGDNLLKYNKDIPGAPTAESWEIASHKNGCCMIKNGELAGKSLEEVIDELKAELLGDIPYGEKFPLLLKVLDANDKLSVQVHPDDDFAALNENGEKGKTEMWYVLEAKPGASLVYGFRPGVDKKIYEEAIKNGTLEEILNYVPVSAGDTFFIRSGTVHAIGSGIIIAEMQQNSDTTYRVYDYNRKDANGNLRELHIEKALTVSDISSNEGKEKAEGVTFIENDNRITYLVNCEYFVFEKLDVANVYETSTNGKMQLLFIAKGDISVDFGGETEKIKKGESVIVPAALGDYSIIGENAVVLRFYVPKSKDELLNVLSEKGIKETSKISG